MKLNKKRISILVSFMCLLILLVFPLCSFDLPDYPDQASEMTTLSGYLTTSEIDTIKQILDYQDLAGQFNSLVPIAIGHSPDSTVFCLFALPSATLTYSTTGQASQTTFIFELSGTQQNAFIRIGFSSEGFAIYNVVSASSISYRRDTLLYYRTSMTGSLIKNSRYDSVSSSTVRSEISDVFNYWNGYISRLSGSGSGASSEELESAYVDGYGDGYFDGKDVGYGLGFESGYIEGVTDGFNTGYIEGNQDGFDIGFSEGYDTGYSDGYYDGFMTGYDSGYSEAERETVIEYVEPIEIDIGRVISGISSVPDNIMNGSFDFELFGINVYGLLKLLIILFVVSAIVVFIIKRAS